MRAAPILLLAALASGCGGGSSGGAPDPVAPPPPGSGAPPPSVNVAFVDVTVVHPDTQTAEANQTVIVRGTRIDAVGASEELRVPGDLETIDGRGLYLTPGLVDMHIHTTGSLQGFRNDLRLFLANGVTTVRVMWGFDTMLNERRLIEDGTTIGPSVILGSPGLDGPGGAWENVTPPVSTPSEARARVGAHADAGYEFIKVYNNLSTDVYDAIVDEATARGVLVLGHVPRLVGIDRVRIAGQRTSEHLIGIKYRASSPFTGGVLDLAEVWALAQASAGTGMWHTPTITVDALSRSEVSSIRLGEEIRFVSDGMVRSFQNGFHQGLDDAVAARERENHEVIVKAIQDSGGAVLVGTDAGFGWMIPGFSFHDEMAALVAAGLTPAEVLSAATTEAAKAMDLETVFGRVAPGLRADLVLVERDPLQDVAAMEAIRGVVAAGRWYTGETLSNWLSTARSSKAAAPQSAPGELRFPEPEGAHNPRP